MVSSHLLTVHAGRGRVDDPSDAIGKMWSVRYSIQLASLEPATFGQASVRTSAYSHLKEKQCFLEFDQLLLLDYYSLIGIPAMVVAPRKSVTAEINFVPLKNCLVNLPQSLINVLVTTNAPVQNVVVEILVKDSASASKTDSTVQRSVYVGWSGMPSTQKATSIGPRRLKQRFPNTDIERAICDIDATFGRTLGLMDGQAAGLLLHLDPPSAHTVNIEPLTAVDWEVIELHANFLELNLLSQIRALPNPSSSSSASVQSQHSHPLSLHLSPTSTANIVITSLAPPLPPTQPFAKIAADAEVIVAPKARPSLYERKTSRSATSIGRKSASARSGRGSGQRLQTAEFTSTPKTLLLRPCDRRYCDGAFDTDGNQYLRNVGLRIWIDPDIIADSAWSKFSCVSVSIVGPAGIKSIVPQAQHKTKDLESGDARRRASSVVARLIPWHTAPSPTHAALSSLLCSSLEASGIVGGMIRVRPAPLPTPNRAVESVLVMPFSAESGHKHEALRFGGQIRAGRDQALQVLLQTLFGSTVSSRSIAEEPLTDGLLLPPLESGSSHSSWQGGILRLNLESRAESERASITWVDGLESDATIEFGEEVASSFPATEDDLPDQVAPMTGLSAFIHKLSTRLAHSSATMLTGGLGSGKSSVARYLGWQLRSCYQTHVSYLPCRKLTADEVRVPVIKDSLEQLFSVASWAVRLGGQSLVILDDLDKVCPAITELQTQDNSRSNQISELICHITSTYSGGSTGVTLLATAQSQDSLNSLLVGANLFKDVIALKAPDKHRRQKLLQAMVGEIYESIPHAVDEQPKEMDGADQAGWMDGCLPSSPARPSGDDLATKHHLDLLDIVRRTEGHMPADLALLVSRARSEALIRSVASEQDPFPDSSVLLRTEDFDRALKGFTPASLRNVTLQSSNTTFSAIGGLKTTRKTLLETLQYPTLYAPIFANCPLRLRSGLLLYGYPGCGKTLLASAVAGECGLNFISVKGPEILNKYIGASEKSVRSLFERAESARPCVLFFDEFDSIAPKRGHDSTGVTDRVVNQLLTQMDGAEGLSGVYVLAATSRPDLIDPALLRPGRLDKSILCDLPDFEDRLDILTVISRNLQVDPEILSSRKRGLYEVAQRTDGYSGADLQAVTYNAHLEAIHDELGSHDAVKEGYRKPNGAQVPRSSTKFDIIRFRFGKEADLEHRSISVKNAKEVAEYRSVVTKLEELRRRRRTAKRQGQDPAVQRGENVAETKGSGDAGTQEVVIQWKHIEASLASTRSSVSPQERERLRRFYGEFMVGRSGELPNGEFSTDVGGRSSLM
ncbi:MAG: hypothetical protein Q9210_001688 [Variospora velana]